MNTVKNDIIKIAKEVFTIEQEEIQKVSSKIDQSFVEVVEMVMQSQGRLVITGMGKSGHIGTKISATLASTGTPSFFMHPAEAVHGDLGMLTQNDIVLAISNSGESEEIVRIIPHVKRMGIKLIGMAGHASSTLAKEADYFLDTSVSKEACPLQLAPTSSTTVTLVMGDALAVALMHKKQFKPENFAVFHPGGSLGRKLLTKVKDIMHTTKLPIVNLESSFQDVITVITQGKLGLCVVLDDAKKVQGIITDGDLRRALKKTDIPRFSLLAKEIMTVSPKAIVPETMAVEAEEYMIKNKIKELLVLDSEKLIGIIQLYDINSL